MHVSTGALFLRCFFVAMAAMFALSGVVVPAQAQTPKLHLRTSVESRPSSAPAMVTPRSC